MIKKKNILSLVAVGLSLSALSIFSACSETEAWTMTNDPNAQAPDEICAQHNEEKGCFVADLGQNEADTFIPTDKYPTVETVPGSSAAEISATEPNSQGTGTSQGTEKSSTIIQVGSSIIMTSVAQSSAIVTQSSAVVTPSSAASSATQLPSSIVQQSSTGGTGEDCSGLEDLPPAFSSTTQNAFYKYNNQKVKATAWSVSDPPENSIEIIGPCL